MNERITRLEQLLKLKERETRLASETWLRSREQFILGKRRHEQLVDYRGGYMKQMVETGQAGCTVGHMRNRINFVGQLDSTIVQLNQQLAQMAKYRSSCETEYRKAKTAEDAVRRLIEKVQIQENIKKDRIEQKESDEYAQKQWYIKKRTSKKR